MAATEFKVGDKVRVRKGIVPDKYYGGVHCASTMARMGGKVLTINHVTSRYYEVDKYAFCWSDEMLEPVEKTLDNLCVGDIVKDGNKTRMILAALDGCYLVSSIGDYIHAGCWYTANDLRDFDYVPVNPDIPEPTIEIDGKRYDEAEVKRAIKDLKPIE